MTIFDQIFNTVQTRMILDRPRAKALHDAAFATATLPGDMAELGVYRGGSAKLMAMTCPHKRIWLFDTFAGLPEPTGIDLHKANEFHASHADVRAWMHGTKFETCAGRFPNSIPAAADRPFSLVHLDADLYESTRDGLAFFWPRLVMGGMIVLDDWLWQGCPGVEKAVKEFDGGKRWESAKYQLTIEKV